MKKVFELHINGKFIQYIGKSELHLLKWIEGDIFTLKPVEITKEKYSAHFGK